MTEKLDIFDLLSNIESSNIEYFSKLDEPIKKSFHPIVAMRWQSSAKSDATILCINEFVNTMVFPLYNHPDLLYKLMVVSSDKKNNRYHWIKKKSKKYKQSISAEVVANYYKIPLRQAVESCQLLSVSDIIEMAEDLGMDKDVIKKIKTEHNAKD